MNFSFQDFKCPLSPEEMQAIRQKRIDDVWDWVKDRYPALRLSTLESNLCYFEEIKKYDDQCNVCVSVQQCPTADGNRMQGELMPDGYLRVWMQGCPQGHRTPKHREEKDERGWVKKQ